ncbi:MAG: hypothetical protein J6A61_03845 [Clostridia bacterium]|nr:hypothetical protein [Clostridia bacterium]
MPEKGSLVVFVTTARMAIPIKNAKISIFKPKTKELLGFRTSDAQGLSEPFETETPDVGLSLTPQNGENPSDVPFSVFDVQIDHPMYQSILIEDVQVFSGRKSIQNADLIPLSEYANPQESTVTYPITPQLL